ncbi:MAG: hypothetical protein MUF43_05060 [Flavobacterium sp.]|jgi:hypothetical protein|nr:hypothetical protein [Flavobacterium sp.]
MEIANKLFNFIWGILLFCFIFFFLDYFEVLLIKHEKFKSLIYFGLLISILFSILLLFTISYQKKVKILLSIIPIISIGIILKFGILNFIFSISTWKTQKILYQNIENSNLKVEFQMLDIGFAGYEKREVEIHYFTDWFYTFKPRKEKYEPNNWLLINEEKNELNLVY